MSFLDTTTLFIAAIVFLVCYVIFYKRDENYKLPPGPRPLPIIGTLHRMSLLLMHNVGKIRQRYGDVSLFYAGPTRLIFLNSIEVVKETVINNANTFSDRGYNGSMCVSTLNPNLSGIIDSDNSTILRQNRSLSLTIFRDLGVGRSTMEQRILEEAQTLVDVISSKDGETFDPWHTLSCSVANVILSVVLSKRYEHDDPELVRIIQLTDEKIATGAHSIVIDSLNFLRYIPPFSSSYTHMKMANKGMIDYMWEHASEHVANHQLGEQSKDFVYSWMDKHYNSKADKTDFDEDDFKNILRDFLIAGTETTATSLKWTIVQLANNPDIQTKIHEEIEKRIGSGRSICLNDREQLPYLEALILEVQRRNTIVPFAVPHYTKRDAKIGEYDIPANSGVCLNLAGIHLDENTFKNPYVFDPDRFIDNEGKFIKHPNVIPFAVGKRSCLGELLARQELFIFTAALVQRFTFLPPDGANNIDDEGVLNFTYCPKRFTVRALPR